MHNYSDISIKCIFKQILKIFYVVLKKKKTLKSINFNGNTVVSILRHSLWSNRSDVVNHNMFSTFFLCSLSSVCIDSRGE